MFLPFTESIKDASSRSEIARSALPVSWHPRSIRQAIRLDPRRSQQIPYGASWSERAIFRLRPKAMFFSPCQLLKGALIDHLKELVIVAVIDVDANDHRPRRIERFLQDRDDLIRSSNHKTRGTECFGIFHRIDRTEIASGLAAVFLYFLHGDHVIRAIDLDHMNEVRFEGDCRFKFHRRKKKSAVANR